MTIIDKVRHAFVGCEQGAIYTTAEIKKMVKTKGSIIRNPRKKLIVVNK